MEPTTVSTRRMIVKKEWSEEDGKYIKKRYFEGPPPQKKVKESRKRVKAMPPPWSEVEWTETEWENFRNVVSEKYPQCLASFDLMYYCGLRAGEVLVVDETSIDFDANTITVDKSLDTKPSEVCMTSTKRTIRSRPILSYHEVRTVPLPEILVPTLKQLAEKANGDYFFTFSMKYLSNAFAQCLKESGIPKKKWGRVYLLRRHCLERNRGEVW